jgi:hypothetical protein
MKRSDVVLRLSCRRLIYSSCRLLFLAPPFLPSFHSEVRPSSMNVGRRSLQGFALLLLCTNSFAYDFILVFLIILFLFILQSYSSSRPLQRRSAQMGRAVPQSQPPLLLNSWESHPLGRSSSPLRFPVRSPLPSNTSVRVGVSGIFRRSTCECSEVLLP